MLGAFAELLKVNISSICLSAWNNSDTTGWVLIELDIEFFFNLPRKF